MTSTRLPFDNVIGDNYVFPAISKYAYVWNLNKVAVILKEHLNPLLICPVVFTAAHKTRGASVNDTTQCIGCRANILPMCILLITVKRDIYQPVVRSMCLRLHVVS